MRRLPYKERAVQSNSSTLLPPQDFYPSVSNVPSKKNIHHPFPHRASFLFIFLSHHLANRLSLMLIVLLDIMLLNIFTSHCMFRRKKRPYQDCQLQLSVSMAPAGRGNTLHSIHSGATPFDRMPLHCGPDTHNLEQANVSIIKCSSDGLSLSRKVYCNDYYYSSFI